MLKGEILLQDTWAVRQMTAPCQSRESSSVAQCSSALSASTSAILQGSGLGYQGQYISRAQQHCYGISLRFKDSLTDPCSLPGIG